jgi:quercetin dioxygenase-like cupin family protein
VQAEDVFLFKTSSYMQKIIITLIGIVFFSVHHTHSQSLSKDKLGFIHNENMVWKSFPAFPGNVKLATLVGEPSKNEPFIVRVKVPEGEIIMPHKHPEDRIYTVISGVFYIGIGENYDESRLTAYPPGTVLTLPGGTPHFHFAKSGEYITQVNAIGPLGLHYIHNEDDPRQKPDKK